MLCISDEETREGFVHNFQVPVVRADPDSRCAAMLVYGRQIVILPFKGDAISEKKDAEDIRNSKKSGIVSSAKVLASYTLDLKSVIQTNNVNNIIDIQFLHGYNQPTLLILYEPLKTFSGRIAVRKDTCRLDVLPFDCLGALPVPKPIGGHAALRHVHQLRGDQDVTTDIHVKPLGGNKDRPGRSKAEFILKGGELYVLTLLVDSMRMIRGFHMDKSAASVLTTCLTVTEDSYLFLGSRLGNSLLLQFTEKDSGTLLPTSEPPSKKKRVEEPSDIDFEVYGQVETSSSSTQISTFSFEVCDSLLNIGPCEINHGRARLSSEEFLGSTTPDPDIELPYVSYSKRPTTGRDYPRAPRLQQRLDGHRGLVRCKHGGTRLSHPIPRGLHHDSTNGARDQPLDKSGFYTEGPTIFTVTLGTTNTSLKSWKRTFGYSMDQSSLRAPLLTKVSSQPAPRIRISSFSQIKASSSSVPKLNILKSNQRNTKSQMRTVTAFKDMEPEDVGIKVTNGVSSTKAQAIENEDDLLYGDSAP
ncbi:Uncharacterized protein FKW44_001819, partial [Caligus rogercresseyi]